jgi:translation initiation factor 1
MSGLFAGTPLERPVTCERCEKPLADCRCPRTASGGILLPKDQPARVRRERRGNKTVTVVAGLDPAASDLPAMLKTLKARLGTGGTLSETRDQKGRTTTELELQGDHRDKLVDLLKSLGYPAKPSGG